MMTELGKIYQTPQAHILIYAAVPVKTMLDQTFYAAEADGLRKHSGVATVRLTNRLSEVAKGDYDGLVSYFYSYSALAALLARARGIPVVATGGGEQVFPELASSRRLYIIRVVAFLFTLLFSSRILATSTSDLERMRRVSWFGHSKLILSPHGAPAVEQINISNHFEHGPDGSLITICGLDTPLNVERKGIPEALKLLAHISTECPHAHLTIVGRTTCRPMVENLARQLDVADRLFFAGYVSEEEKLTLLRTHRYYVQLSIYEGFGVGALEALAQGCRIIHSGVGGLTDTVADFGIIVPRDAIDKFSLSSVPPQKIDHDSRLKQHLQHFLPATRSATIWHSLFRKSPIFNSTNRAPS